MKARKNDSPVVTFTISHNYTSLKPSLAKCLLVGAAFKATDHFLLDKLLGSPRAFPQLNAKQCLTPCLVLGLLETQTSLQGDPDTDQKFPTSHFPDLV